MKRTMARAVAVLLATTSAARGATAQTAVAPAVEAMLIEGRLDDSHRQLAAQLKSAPNDDNARFALGIVETLQGGERLMQSLYRYGMNPRWTTMLPIVRLPVPANPDPEPLTNADFRAIVQQLLDDLSRAEATLSEVQSSDVHLPLHLGLYRLDFDGDGVSKPDETLWRMFSRITGQRVDEQTAAQFVIAFDAGDVHWLRGYCRLLSAMCEIFLAHDTSKLHDHTAQLFFPTAQTLINSSSDYDTSWSREFISDAIAFIHLLQLPVVEPDRLRTAHAHLLAVIDLSRSSWEAILAEEDDDREWVPRPQQKDAAIPGAAITDEMVKGWHSFLDELEAVLQGEKLVPYWRGDEPIGVNVKKVFYEPRELDLVLWVQGGAAVPYLDEGPMTEPAFWNRLQREFRGQFFWFALWVN